MSVRQLHLQKVLAFLLCIVLCGSVFVTAAGEDAGQSYAWKITRTQQSGDTLSVWYVTDQKVNKMLSYKMGNVDLTERSAPSDTYGVGYVFVVDATKYYSAVRISNLDVITYAVGRMAPNDRVAFVKAGSEISTTSFVYAANAPSLYSTTFSNNPPNEHARMWDGIDKAVDLVNQDYESVQHVIIALTDGDEKGSSMTAENLAQRFNKEYLPLHVFVYDHGKSQDASAALVEFGNKISSNGSSTVTSENYKTALDTATRVSSHVYRSELALSTEVLSVPADQRYLTIAFQGGHILAKSNLLNLIDKEIPTYTPEPTTPPPTPVPETPVPTPDPVYIGYDTDNKGEIQELHRLLKMYYYYDGEASSTYTDATEEAVAAFYKVNNLTDKPSRGGLTIEAFQLLAGGGAVPNPTSTPTPSPTPDPTFIGYNTENRVQVQQLNNRLVDLYYLEEEMRNSSTYTDATEVAVLKIYETYGLTDKPDNGGLTKAAFDLIMSDAVRPLPTVTPEPTETPDPNPCYIGYETGVPSDIYTLHQRLGELYYYTGEYGTIYTDATELAVTSFCDANGLIRPTIKTGITKAAFDALCSGTNVVAMPTTTPDPTIKFTFSDLTGEAAMNTYDRLLELGYLAEKTNFDENNIALAVRAFCLKNGLTNRVGVMTVEAYDLLMSSQAKPAVEAPKDIVLDDGKTEVSKEVKEQILQFQTRLKDLGYFNDIEGAYTPGVFDDKTSKAYARFMEVNKISGDPEKVSWEEQQVVLNSTVKNPSLNLFEQVQGMVDKDVQVADQKMPMWILAAAVAAVVIIIIVILVIFLGKKRKAKKNDEGSGSSGSQYYDFGGSGNNSLFVGEDKPTEDVSGEVEIGADAPTTVNTGSWHLTVMIVDSKGQSTYKSFDLEEGQSLSIGRSSQADIMMDAEDTTVSRSHGSLAFSGETLYYTDCSRAGSYVGGQKINQSQIAVTPGTEIRIGHCSLKIDLA